MTNLQKLQKADKLNQVTKKDGTLKARYSDLIKFYVNDRILHLKSWSGSYKHLTLTDKQAPLELVLNLLGYKYTVGNDAPQGGVEGDFIKISKIALRNLKELAS